jgi:hypothetical protein
MKKYGLSRTEIKLLSAQRELRILLLMNPTDIFMPLVPDVSSFGGPSKEGHEKMIREETEKRCSELRNRIGILSVRLDNMLYKR